MQELTNKQNSTNMKEFCHGVLWFDKETCSITSQQISINFKKVSLTVPIVLHNSKNPLDPLTMYFFNVHMYLFIVSLHFTIYHYCHL